MSGHTHRTRFLRAAVVAATTGAMLQLPALPAVAATPDVPTVKMLGALDSSTAWLGALGAYGRFGQSLPLTSLVPGGAAGLDLAGVYAGLGAAGSDVGDPPADLTDLASKLSAYDTSGSATAAQVTTTAVVQAEPALSTAAGIRVQLTATRTVEAPLKINRTTGKPVTLDSGAGPGIPLVLTWTSDVTMRIDGAAVWLDAAPVLTLTSAVASTPFAGASTEGVVGVAKVQITPDSTATLSQTLTAVVDDDGVAAGDGKLFFFEPTSAPDVGVPGELTLPQTENVVVTRTGTVAADLGLTTPLYRTGTDPGARVSIASTATTDATYVPAITTNAAYDTKLAAFQNIGTPDLLGGLGQLVAALTSVQRHPSVDKPLPYLDGTFADTASVGGEIAKFVIDHTLADDPATPQSEFGQADFTTVDDMFTLLKAEVPSLQDSQLLPSFDPTTDGRELTFRVHLVKDAPAAPVGFTVSPYRNADSSQNPVGRPSIGSALRATTGAAPVSLTGLSALQDNAATYVSGATAKTSYSVDVLVGVLLRDAVPCATSCDARPDDGFVQTDDLPPFLRFFLRTGNDAAPEITLDTAITSPVAGTTVGRAGFAEVKVGGPSVVTIRAGVDVAKPTIAVQLSPSTPGDSNLPLQELLSSLSADSSPLVAGARSYGARVELVLDSRNPGTPGSSALPGLAHVTADQPDATAPLTAAQVTLDSSAQLLKALDINLGAADALAGRYLSVLDAVMETASSINSAIPGDVLGLPLPSLGTTPAALFTAYADLRTQVTAIRNGALPPSLQAMNTALASGLAVHGATMTFTVRDLGTTGADGVPADPNVISRLSVDRVDRPVDIPLSVDAQFDVGGLETGGKLASKVTTKGSLSIPVPLTAAEPSSFKVLDDASLSVKVAVSSSDLVVAANLAGLKVSLGKDGAKGMLKGGFTVSAGVDGADPADVQPIALGTFLGSLRGSFAPATGGQTCALPDPDGAGDLLAPAPVTGSYLCAAFPVFVNGNALNPAPESATNTNVLRVAVDGTGPGGLSATYPTNLDAGYLAAAALDFGPIKDGLAKLGMLISDGLDAMSLGGKLPLIGDDLKQAAQAAKGLDTIALADLIKNGYKPAAGAKVGDVRTQLDGLAQQFVDTGLVRDTEDAGNTPSKQDVRIALDCDVAAGLQPCTAADDGDDAAKIQGVQIQVVIGQGDGLDPGDTPTCPAGQKCSDDQAFDLGIPALNLQVTSSGDPVRLAGAWEVELGFGVDKQAGFYLLENPATRLGATDTGDTSPEIKVGLRASLGDDFKATAKLAFLQLDITDKDVLAKNSGPGGTLPDVSAGSGRAYDEEDDADHRSDVTLTGGLNLKRPNGSGPDERIAGADFENLLSNLGQAFEVKVDGKVNVDLNLALSAAGLAAGLPQVSADLLLDWKPSFTSGAGGFQAGDLELRFNNVGVDLGAILGNTIGGALKDVRKYTKPIDPIREFLFSPIPVISDISTTFGGPNVTMFDLLKAQNPDGKGLQLLEDINTLLDVIKLFESADPADVSFVIGSFSLNAGKALGPPQIGAGAAGLIGSKTLSGAADDEVPGGTVVGDAFKRGGVLDDVLSVAGEKVPAIRDALNKTGGGDTTPDFTFPLFEKPDCAFTMLLGANCVIAQWAPDDLSARFDFDQSFGPFFGVLYITLSGYAEVKANVIVGYDTQGLRNILEGGSVLSLIDGFFLSDLDPKTGEDRPEIVLTGGIAAGGKVSVVIAEVGVEGGLSATLNANLRDGGPMKDPASIDGVIRFDEVAAAARTNILCLFDFSGALEAFLRVYATFGISPFSYEESYELARVKLLDFSGLTVSCEPPVPVLATDQPDGSLVLNVGPRAADRKSFTADINEKFTLTQRKDGTVSVTAFGYTEEHKKPTRVTFDFGAGDDSLITKGSQAASGALAPTLTGKDVNYGQPTAGPTGFWTHPLAGAMGPSSPVAGTSDADVATGGEGVDSITGGYGDDRIDLKGGADKADGGAGNDQVLGGTGDDDLLEGGADDDTVDGGLGADKISGGAGRDRLLGGIDLTMTNGTLVKDGNDFAYGGTGKDFFDLGNGDDQAWGDGTPTSADSSDGAGDGGVDDADEIKLGPGDDKAWAGGGGTSRDCASAARGDIVRGDAGADELHGQGGTDCLYGEAGADKVYGGPGADVADGGDDGDRVDGNDGDDLVLGGGSGDTLRGNAGKDQVLGASGDDDISGGLGADSIKGEAGDDWIAGDDGAVAYPAGVRTLTVADDQVTGDADTIAGGAGADKVRGEGGADKIVGGSEDDDLAGNSGIDTIEGGNGLDTIRGNVGNDKLYGGPQDDLVIGDAGDDLLTGDSGDDRLTGGSATTSPSDDGDDQVYGGVGNDTALGDNGTISPALLITLSPSSAAAGQAGSDVLTGDDGDDVLYGQDRNDLLFGGNGADRGFGGLGDDLLEGQNDADFLIGDQGELSSTGLGLDPGGAPKLAARLTAPDSGGVDTINGGTGDDHAYGGAADDLIGGGLGDDHLEGNGGADTVDGLDKGTEDGSLTPGDIALIGLAIGLGDHDDIIGGSSSTSDSRADRPDVGETTLRGGPGGDVVAGDNADIVRTVSSDPTKWVQDPAQSAPKRTVTLLDTSKTVAQLTGVSGPDDIRTGLGNDIAFGEGGDDLLDGNEGDDVLVGNQGSETIDGGTGQDDLVGGSMADAGVPSTGRPDVGDSLYGGPDEDVLAGDNANVVRTITNNAWALDPLGVGYGKDRVVTLYDLQRPAAKVDTVAGPDLLLGQGQRDRLYGQADGDTAKGGPGDDLVYGGQGADLVEGDDGEDDVIGGSFVKDEPDGGDRVQGGGGADVLLGDNGIVDRGPLPGGIKADRVTAAVGVSTPRSIRFLDIDGASDTSGRDLVAAGEGADVGYGQDKDDQVLGGTGQDRLEGMGGADVVLGDSTSSAIAPDALAAINLRGGLLPLPSPLPAGESAEPELSGSGGVQDQDDLLGGTAKAAALDGGDLVAGEGGADFLLGDNGTLTRSVVAGAYTTMTEYDGAVRRKAVRFDVAAATTLSGPDLMYGGAGNDRAWGQDQDDTMYGGAGNDDLIGELGDDSLYGEAGEDALLGDRGGILNTVVKDGSLQAKATASLPGPTFDKYVGLRLGSLDRRVSLTTEVDPVTGAKTALVKPGTTDGGNDTILGGDDHDVVHAGFGDDLVNGEFGGDWLFGNAGRDVMWGGRGAKSGDPDARGANDSLVDYLFGGDSGTTDASQADILDVRPRPDDPLAWKIATNTVNDDPNVPATIADNQHHQGVDWIYGGSGRDVLQADVGNNGPDSGDRLRDWVGNYNLFLHCQSSYGDDTDTRLFSPALREFLYVMAWGSGAGLTYAEVRTQGTSADADLALREKDQTGSPMTGNPGHFDTPSCAP